MIYIHLISVMIHCYWKPYGIHTIISALISLSPAKFMMILTQIGIPIFCFDELLNIFTIESFDNGALISFPFSFDFIF